MRNIGRVIVYFIGRLISKINDAAVDRSIRNAKRRAYWRAVQEDMDGVEDR